MNKLRSWFNFQEIYNLDVTQLDRHKFSGKGVGKFIDDEEEIYFDYIYDKKASDLSIIFYYKDGTYKTTKGVFI